MRNFISIGENVTVPAPAAVASGDVVVLGDLVGIASTDAATGDAVALVTRGVFELAKVGADAFAIGDAVYVRDADGLVSATATDNTRIGIAVSTAGNPSAVVRVRLDG